MEAITPAMDPPCRFEKSHQRAAGAVNNMGVTVGGDVGGVADKAIQTVLVDRQTTPGDRSGGDQVP